MFGEMPFIQHETCFSIEGECIDVDDIDVVKKLYKKLKKTNPVVALWIKQYSKHTKDKIGAMACALITYRLIESQMEADAMNDML